MQVKKQQLELDMEQQTGSKLLLLDLHIDFLGDRSGGLVFPSLYVFSTVCCDPHSQREAEVDVFLELSCFFNDPMDVGIWSLVPLPFLNPV